MIDSRIRRVYLYNVRNLFLNLCLYLKYKATDVTKFYLHYIKNTVYPQKVFKCFMCFDPKRLQIPTRPTYCLLNYNFVCQGEATTHICMCVYIYIYIYIQYIYTHTHTHTVYISFLPAALHLMNLPWVCAPQSFFSSAYCSLETFTKENLAKNHKCIEFCSSAAIFYGSRSKLSA